MTKITLPDITSGYNLSAINSNFQKVEDELNNKVLYRQVQDGEPNQMKKNLDMNGNDILNADNISTNNLFLDGREVIPEGLVNEAALDALNQFKTDLADVDGVELVGYKEGMNLDDLINTEPLVVTPFITAALTHQAGFQDAVNAGNVRVPSGSVINISGEITIPANRLIIVDKGATLTSNGRFTAYGVNNVHWIIHGSVISAGMTAAPAKSGWPNTGEGTQNGDERGFIEFGGVTFAGNDGHDYSVYVGPSGVIGGDWVGTPNFSDPVRQVNRKGVAAWNCSDVNFTIDGEIYGFEGEAVYWFSRSAAGKNVYMRALNLHDCRFNGLNVNSLLASEKIKIEKSVTKNTYQGIESSAGDVLDCLDYSSVQHSIYAGQGHGGGKRRIAGNQSFDCLGVPFSILYDRTYESLGRVNTVVVTDNHAVNPVNGFLAIADIENIQAHGNTCSGMQTGRFLQVTGCMGGALTGNTNFNPAAGTEHYYEADCYSLFKSGNEKVPLGGSYNSLMRANDAFTGGFNSLITSHGNRENFRDLRATNPVAGTGPEYRFSYDQTLPFVAATIATNLAAYDGSGAKADLCFNNLKINTGDMLGTSWIIRSTSHFEPFIDAFSNIGSASKRANTVYASTGTINTSDEREKTRLDIVDAERAAAIEIKQNMWKFQFNSANDTKDGGGRYHFGIGAQTVGEILTRHGLDPDKYAFFCYDEWNNENGDSGNRYGIRYEELLCFIISAI